MVRGVYYLEASDKRISPSFQGGLGKKEGFSVWGCLKWKKGSFLLFKAGGGVYSKEKDALNPGKRGITMETWATSVR